MALTLKNAENCGFSESKYYFSLRGAAGKVATLFFFYENNFISKYFFLPMS